MTSNNFFKKLKSKLVWALTVLCLIFSSAFCFVACSGTSDSTVKDPTFSYTETNDGLISNGSFSYGTANIDFTTASSLPRTSVTGWTKASSTSDVNSGVIDVSKDGWDTLIKKLYDDSDFLTYAESTFGFNKKELKEELKTDSAVKAKIIEDYFTDGEGKTNRFPNPGIHAGALDNKVYMLNNYDKDKLGHGLNQKITSASTITLEKGNYGKFTVWVKTQNLRDWGNNGFGAYIAVNNTFNSLNQAQYRIQNIVSDSWKQYTIYVKADEVYNTSVTLVLGLGEDSYNAVEGTAFFDDIEFTHVDKSEFDAATVQDTKVLTYADTNNDVTTTSSSSVYLYDMTLDRYLSDTENELTNNVSAFKNETAAVVNADYTKSNTGTIGNKFGSATITSGAIAGGAHIADTLKNNVISLDKASYTLTYTSADFIVKPESYVYVEFYVKNELSKFGASDITFDVFEDVNKDGNKNVQYKTKGIASVNTISEEWTKVGLILKNNFTNGDRAFIIDVVIGPTDVATAVTAPEYASGTVTITTPLVAKGTTVQYNDSDIENKDYKLYSLFNGSASGSVALYAGMQQDYTEDSSSTSYPLSYSSSDLGAILSRPAIPTSYTGVVAKHTYIMNENEHDNLETDINDRVNGYKGSYAGLINTKYVDNYELEGIKSALGFNAGDKDIQPLMIYNNEADSYGFIGAEKTISASAYAKVSVKVKVVGTAVANIYLVDVTGKAKEVILFDENKLTGIEQPKKLMFSVSSDMMDDDGWTTVTFYVGNGATAKDFRVELWNGDRDGINNSKGYVFFDSINVSTSGAFSEPANVADAFTTSGNPLYDIGSSIKDSTVTYTRKLTDTEIKFNSEQTDSSAKVNYNETIVWAENNKNIYAIYNTIDPVEVDPYENETEDENVSTGCTAETDPSTFWLSFSSILLGVVLVLAILMLIIKNVRRKRKANASDAKSHFKVVSRSRIYKPTKAKIEESEDIIESEEVEEDENLDVESEEISENEEISEEQKLDDYVYGEVQDFGESDNESSDNE